MFHYSLSGYGSMVADAVRLPAYRQALEKALKPGDIVADIGTGPGLVALIACRFGAGHVYAVEPNDVIQVAREVAAANGFQDRITFLQDLTTMIDPPRRCDVLVSDLRGCVPFYERHIPTIVDARERWLAPGGRQIPQRDFVYAALVESAKVYAEYAGPWRQLGFDVEAVRRRTVNTCGKCQLLPEHLLSAPRLWAELDYRAIVDPDAHRLLRFNALREGSAHGIALWFESELFEGVGFSSAPGRPELVYGQLFFPFVEPLSVETGEEVSVDIQARLVGDDYVWRWTTEWIPASRERGRAVRFEQSSFFGTTVSPDRLRRIEPGHRPLLNSEGRLKQSVLAGMTGGLTLDEIARRLTAENPKRFSDQKQALAYVSELSTRFSE